MKTVGDGGTTMSEFNPSAQFDERIPTQKHRPEQIVLGPSRNYPDDDGNVDHALTVMREFCGDAFGDFDVDDRGDTVEATCEMPSYELKTTFELVGDSNDSDPRQVDNMQVEARHQTQDGTISANYDLQDKKPALYLWNGQDEDVKVGKIGFDDRGALTGKRYVEADINKHHY